MKEKQVILNGNSFEILEYIKGKLVLENFELSTVHDFDFEYGKGYFMVFEKYYFRIDNSASLTLHIHPLRKDQVKLVAIISGSSTGIIKIDWGVENSLMKKVEKLIEPFK